jgi:hypothetical protein
VNCRFVEINDLIYIACSERLVYLTKRFFALTRRPILVCAKLKKGLVIKRPLTG